ncbi:MAG: polyamine ABC transporter ATP-binding protein [Oscillospiraceae bacterium]|jgi:spermidine/putrescine transport system ATP-binding protein|nr:polyamine ABC transporter ATP-binding protein [Oscillospiraceae bacterium]
MAKAIVEIKNVNKFYGDNHVVKDLDMEIYEGEFLSILGPSGCGKTTTLRMIAGFEQQTDGVITVEGERVENKEPFERNVNTVFQSYALFPHMTVHDNVAYGLKMKKVKKAEIAGRVEDALSMVRLEGFGKRYPAQLSGGQRQRVAIARAIINNPRVLLLDEPLGALDMKLRKQMQIELKNLQKQLGITFVYVTHDQEEALTMSDRIAVMSGGVLEQIGTPAEIYEKPTTKFVADFIGETNLFEAVEAHVRDDGTVCLNAEAGELTGADPRFSAAELVYLSVRPEKTLASESPVTGFSLRGTVRENIYIGTVVKSTVVLQNGQEIRVSSIAGAPVPAAGSARYIHWNPGDAVIIHSKSNTILDLMDSLDLGAYVAGGA